MQQGMLCWLQEPGLKLQMMQMGMWEPQSHLGIVALPELRGASVEQQKEKEGLRGPVEARLELVQVSGLLQQRESES